MSDIFNTMVGAWRVTAYTYNAAEYCRECMWEIATHWIDLPAGLRSELKSMSVEDALDAIAGHFGIDRQNEGTFDSGDFPKVIFESQLCQEYCGDGSCDHEEAGCGHERCGSCGTKLCEQ